MSVKYCPDCNCIMYWPLKGAYCKHGCETCKYEAEGNDLVAPTSTHTPSSATTKTDIEKILLKFRQFARHNDSDMKLDSDLTIEDYIEYDKNQLDEALAAIDNYTTQRVIEELQGFSSGHLTNSGHKYLTKRYESLKGGIDVVSE